MLDGMFKHRAGPAETIAGIEQAIDLRSVPRPLLDLGEVVDQSSPARRHPKLKQNQQRIA
jgi:hypothetical protein